MAEPKTTASRLWLLSALILLLLLSALSVGLPGCDDSDDAAVDTTSAAQPDGTAMGPTTRDLGKVEVVDPDPSTLVESELHGRVPANNVLVVMKEGQGRAQAEEVAAQLGGVIVGEIEFMDLYQIQTSGTSAQDLEAALETAKSAPGVKYAVPNGLEYLEASIQGKTCSPLHDPAYQTDQNYIPAKMIGMIEAWHVMAAARIRSTMQPVHVGVVDSAVYTRSGNGFTRELHFPDAGGAFPEDEVRVSGLEAKDTTDLPDPDRILSHGTSVVHVIAADRDDGVTGVAANLEDLLTVTCSNRKANIPLPPGFDPDDPDVSVEELYEVGYFGRSMAEVIKQIAAGAEIINLSFGANYEPGELQGLIWVDFLERMEAAYPDVLFVASAGNEDKALDGLNHVPGGIRAPNLITVGALDRSGDRAKISDWKWRPAKLQQMYDDLVAQGKMPAGWTLQDYINGLDMANPGKGGSNYAGPGGEVTLAACGTNVLLGRDAAGNAVTGNGTSFAAPQVVAAAALLRSINPGLMAEDIKNILVRTGATEVTVGGTRMPVPAEVGGRVLRVDRAVLEVINQMRTPDDQLIYGDLLELMTIELTAEEHEFGYLVEATTPRVEDARGVDMIIIVEGDAEIFGEQIHRIYNSLETASWTVSPGPDPVKVKVYRLDNGACAFLELPGSGGSPTSTTAAGSTTTTAAAQGPRWVRAGPPVVNASGARLEYRGGGTDPDFFGEERFKGMFIIYSVSETSFSVKDRWQDREYVGWDVTITCDFDAPEAVLIPGEEYELTAAFSHGGMANEPSPGARFAYHCPGGGLQNTDVLAYYPWAATFDGVDSKTWTLKVPAAQPGATLEIKASWWNTPCCDVTWTYKAE